MSDTIFKLGDRKYRVEKQWVEAPAQKLLNNVSGVAVDNEGYVFILQRSDPFMLIFNQDGKLVDQWHNSEIADGHYVEITSENEVHVVDRDQHRIVVFNRNGEINRILDGGDADFNHPTDVATANNGELYVSDGYGNVYVHHLDESGELIHTWGGLGKEAGSFMTPHAVLIDRKERVLVTDRENDRVQIFDKDGKYLKEINNIYRPMDIFEDDNGFIYVTDQIPSLNLFDSNHEFIGRCRTISTYGHGVSVDRDGNIYIAEMLPDGVTKLAYLKNS